MINLLGYVAMVLTASSFLMTDVTKLRLVSIAGCIAWITYGSILESTPIIITNALILGINLYKLKK
jgi:hypothetical protein